MGRSYRELAHVRGFPWLITSVFLSRLGNAMSQITVVVYLLERTGSPAIAGAGAAAQLVPGVVVSPFAGLWLDRVSRRGPLVARVQLARAAILAAVVTIGELGSPPAIVYLVLLAGLGLTFPLGNPGFRALVPVIVPRRLWDQANALDSITFDLAFVVGPALAAVIVAGIGAPAGIVVQVGVTLLAALTAWQVHEPADRPRSYEPLIKGAAKGLRAVVSSQALRATMSLMVMSGLGFGCFTIGLPLWVHSGLGLSPGAAGWMWAALSLGSVLGGIAYGTRRPPGSDANHIVGFVGLGGIPMLFVPFMTTLAEGMVAMFLAGVCTAPFVIAMFGLRQRALPVDLHGRVFAITIAVNAAGAPAGALLAGLIVGWIGVHTLLFGAGLAQLLAAVIAAAVLRSGSVPGPVAEALD